MLTLRNRAQVYRLWATSGSCLYAEVEVCASSLAQTILFGKGIIAGVGVRLAPKGSPGGKASALTEFDGLNNYINQCVRRIMGVKPITLGITP